MQSQTNKKQKRKGRESAGAEAAGARDTPVLGSPGSHWEAGAAIPIPPAETGGPHGLG